MANAQVNQVGPGTYADGAQAPMRAGKLGDAIMSELHGRFYEQCYRGNLFSGGMTVTSISNATFTTATLSATGTPIVGVWNPSNSTANLVPLLAKLSTTVTAATNTGCGSFVWVTSTSNAAISTGGTPWNRKTLGQAGSVAKNMAGVALTGITNNPTVLGASSLAGGSAGSFSFVGTAAGQFTVMQTSWEPLDGSIIVPPGGFFGLFCTTTPVAHSAASELLWEEVPL